MLLIRPSSICRLAVVVAVGGMLFAGPVALHAQQIAEESIIADDFGEELEAAEDEEGEEEEDELESDRDSFTRSPRLMPPGHHQHAIHHGIAPYHPNSLGDGLPEMAGRDDGGYVQLPTPVDGPKVRANPASFDDHFSQPRMFWLSMTPVERAHIIGAYTFELSKCFHKEIRERQLTVLARIDPELCAEVAAGLGLPAPTGKVAENVEPSPALSQIVTVPGPIAGRVVGVFAVPGADLGAIEALRTALSDAGAVLHVLSPVGGELTDGDRTVVIDRVLVSTRSIEYDAMVIASGAGGFVDVTMTVLLQEMFRHCKALAAWGDGQRVLVDAGLDTSAPGVLTATALDTGFTAELVALVGMHRSWARAEVNSVG